MVTHIYRRIENNIRSKLKIKCTGLWEQGWCGGLEAGWSVSPVKERIKSTGRLWILESWNTLWMCQIKSEFSFDKSSWWTLKILFIISLTPRGSHTTPHWDYDLIIAWRNNVTAKNIQLLTLQEYLLFIAKSIYCINISIWMYIFT